MGFLQELKLTNVQRTVRLSPVLHRRHKLVDKLHEQLMLAKAMADGNTYEVAVVRRRKDSETGAVTKVDGIRKVKPWFFTADSGKTMLQVKYGMKVLELAKGKASVEIASPEKLIPTIELLKQATLAGELDAQIELMLKS